MGKLVMPNKLKSVLTQAEGAKKSFNPKVPAGVVTAPAPKMGPKSPAKSAVAPKVQGSPGAPAKNPANNGMGRKLGNHYSNS